MRDTSDCSNPKNRQWLKIVSITTTSSDYKRQRFSPQKLVTWTASSEKPLKSRCIPITSTGKEVSISVGPGSHYYIDWRTRDGPRHMAESAQPFKPQHCNSTAATLIYPYSPSPPHRWRIHLLQPLSSYWSYHFPTRNLFGINTPYTPSSIIPHPPAYEDGTDREFQNVGYKRYMDAGDLPKR